MVKKFIPRQLNCDIIFIGKYLTYGINLGKYHWKNNLKLIVIQKFPRSSD